MLPPTLEELQEAGLNSRYASRVSVLCANNLDMKVMQWGCTNEGDTQTACVQHFAQNGHVESTVLRACLIIFVDEPCLACSSDGLVL